MFVVILKLKWMKFALIQIVINFFLCSSTERIWLNIFSHSERKKIVNTYWNKILWLIGISPLYDPPSFLSCLQFPQILILFSINNFPFSYYNPLSYSLSSRAIKYKELRAYLINFHRIKDSNSHSLPLTRTHDYLFHFAIK